MLGLHAGDKGSAGNWRELFKDLKNQGLDSSKVVLCVMDRLPGVEKVFKEEFAKAAVQRCQVHVARNVLGKVPKKFKQIIADGIRSIFYKSCKQKAMAFFEDFKFRWSKDLPSAVKCLESSLDSCLTYLDFLQDKWIVSSHDQCD